MAAKFKIYKKDGYYRFALKAGNGEILTNSELYATKDGCKRGIEAVKKFAPIANIIDESEDK